MEGSQNIAPPSEHDLLVSAMHLETSAEGTEDSSYTRTANFLKLLAPRMAMFESIMK